MTESCKLVLYQDSFPFYLLYELSQNVEIEFIFSKLYLFISVIREVLLQYKKMKKDRILIYSSLVIKLIGKH